jgi:hypothetical protein
MDTSRKNAIIVGVLFIIATVASSLCVVISSSILDAPDYLGRVSGNERQMIVAALLMSIDVVAVVGIAVTMYPILKKHRETLALGYVAARMIEGVLHLVYVITLLLLLTLSQEFAQAGAPDASYYQTGGTLLLAASDWTFSLGLGLAFALSALILNYSLYRSELVPRWLSGWGFVGAALVLALFLLRLFGIHPAEILDLVIALQEMVFAVWLIVKGFNQPVVKDKEVLV